MKVKTAITEMLGIELPIVGAPMFLVSYPDLVVAVSNAGGIGCFPSQNYRTTDQLKEGLAEMRNRTSKPIGVNLTLHKDYNPDWPAHLATCLDHGVELIIASLGTPRTAVKDAQSTGAKVLADCTTLRHARILAKTGVDGLIAVAGGAGGHAGNISPYSLIPQVKEEIGLPVVAAGAISSGRQMAASLALGADAVYVGTRLIATPEAQAAAEYKQMIVDCDPTEIVYTDKVSGLPANWMKKSLDNFKTAQAEQISASKEGARWRDIWSAGHGVGQIKSVEPAADIVTRMAEEYQAVCETLPALQTAVTTR